MHSGKNSGKIPVNSGTAYEKNQETIANRPIAAGKMKKGSIVYLPPLLPVDKFQNLKVKQLQRLNIPKYEARMVGIFYWYKTLREDLQRLHFDRCA